MYPPYHIWAAQGAGMLVGLGAPVNNHQQCRKQQSQGMHLLLGGLGVVGVGQKLYLGR